MIKTFRVVDCQSAGNSTTTLEARTPEEAARLATGERLVRSGHATSLRAKVYFDGTEAPTMVRLYSASHVLRKHRKAVAADHVEMAAALTIMDKGKNSGHG